MVTESKTIELPRALTEPFGAIRLALYRSHLKPTGAEYELTAAHLAEYRKLFEDRIAAIRENL